MKWFIGNLFSLLSLLGMVLVTLILAGMILFCGIDLWEAVKSDLWWAIAWELLGVVIFVYWSVAWVVDGIDWWIATDHKIQKRLFGKVY